MSNSMFVRHCSPTLAGLKAGNMFSCVYENTSELLSFVQNADRIFSPKGIRVVILRARRNRALIYVFRPKAVENVLGDSTAESILSSCGYSDISVRACLCELISRLADEEDDFPHEVGLFLGYPPEDVKGFINKDEKNHKCTGCWKVYGDEEKAKKTFAKYKKCTDVYCSLWEKGCSIEKLTVADH